MLKFSKQPYKNGFQKDPTRHLKPQTAEDLNQKHIKYIHKGKTIHKVSSKSPERESYVKRDEKGHQISRNSLKYLSINDSKTPFSNRLANMRKYTTQMSDFEKSNDFLSTGLKDIQTDRSRFSDDECSIDSGSSGQISHRSSKSSLRTRQTFRSYNTTNTFFTSNSKTPFSSKEERRTLKNFQKEPKPMTVMSAKDFMKQLPTEPKSLVSPKKSLREKIEMKEKLLWTQPKEFIIKKVKSEPTLTKVPFLNAQSLNKYEKRVRKKSMEDVNNSINEMNVSIESAGNELNQMWTQNKPAKIPKEIDERLQDMKKKREIIWKKVKKYKYDKLF